MEDVGITLYNEDIVVITDVSTVPGPKGDKGDIGNTGAQGPQGVQGPQGLQGPSGGSTNWLGDWSLSFSYSVYDAVSHNGSSYICINDNTSASNTEPGIGINWLDVWQLLASKGDAGPQGIQGIQGPQGVAGVNGINGANGADGTNGANGTNVLNGTGAPSGGTGVNGDFYIDTSVYDIYGPKNVTWPVGVSLVGPQGPSGSVTDGDKGDVVVSSNGAVWTVDNQAITYAKIQNVSATDRLLGRDTAGAGTTEEISVTGGIEFTGTNAIRIGAFSGGDVTKSAGSAVLTIANAAVTYAKIQNVSATSRILGRKTAGAGSIEELTGSDVSTIMGLGTIATFNEGTAAEYRQNTTGKALSTDKVWTAAGTHETMSDGATVTPDFNYFDHDLTIAGTGRTLANPTNIKVGQKGTIYITQDGTGSRTITSWGTYYKFINGNKPTLTTTAGARDRITYDVVSSTQIDCFFAANMS